MIAEDVRLGPDSVTPDVLCHACRSLFESEATWHHLHLPLGTDPSTVNELTRFCRPFRNVGDIHRCAQAGCHLCVYMRYDLNNFPRHTATSRGALHHGTKRSGFENYELLHELGTEKQEMGSGCWELRTGMGTGRKTFSPPKRRHHQ